MDSVQQLMNETSAWSDKTFSNGEFKRERALAISYHLQKEAKELTDAIGNYMEMEAEGMPADVLISARIEANEEFADCFILLIDAACHFGLNANELITVAFNKLEKNKKRVWGEPDENGVCEHIR